MVTIEKGSITIVIEEIMPAEVWCDMVNDLIDLLYCESDDYTQKHRAALILLQNMIPSLEQAKTMYGVPPEAGNR